MAAKFVLHRVTVDADKEFFFLSRPETYAGDISIQTGIKKAAQSEQDKPQCRVHSLVAKHELFRLAITYTSGGRARTAKLLCARAKLTTCISGLIGKTYTGNGRSGKITSVRVTQKAIYDF